MRKFLELFACWPLVTQILFTIGFFLSLDLVLAPLAVLVIASPSTGASVVLSLLALLQLCLTRSRKPPDTPHAPLDHQDNPPGSLPPP